MNNVARHNGMPSQTKRPQDCSPVVHVFVMLLLLILFLSSHSSHILSSYSFPSLFMKSQHIPFMFPFQCACFSFFFCFCLMFPGTRAQQAFRTEPKNLTVRMGATAVLRCEVLRASGTVQWAKDGFLLGPERSLPGFPRYSMIGNPERGKPGYSRNMVYGLLSFDGPIKTK